MHLITAYNFIPAQITKILLTQLKKEINFDVCTQNTKHNNNLHCYSRLLLNLFRYNIPQRMSR